MDQISKPLLQWYDIGKRELPWRGIADPYRIWLSEIMLQQTRSETVIDYYDRFLRRFPTVFELAAASEDEVLKMWEGLGYYSRARNLRKCAIEVARGGGAFPKTAAELEKLPGIGKYTAAAIASIAYNEPVCALDGNHMRVLSRVFRVDRVLKTPFDLIDEANAALDRARPGDYNQALMDLGASICLPKNPACDRCPLQDRCEARASGDQLSYPRRPAPIAKKESDRTVLLVQTPRGFCVRRREDALLRGLWEFPALEGKIEGKALARAVEAMGVTGVSRVIPLRESKHVFTHLVWHMTGWHIIAETPINDCKEADAEAIAPLAFPNALRVYRAYVGGVLLEET